MLSEFLYYLLGILAMVGGILLLERIVAGPHATAGTGYARVDSAFDFDRLRSKQYGALGGQPAPGTWGTINTPTSAVCCHEYRRLRDYG